MPTILNINIIPLTNITTVPCFSVNTAQKDVIEIFEWAINVLFSFSKIITIVGKIRNVIIKETRIPELIIQPKVFTGRISHRRRELKPAMVVKVAKTQGFIINKSVSRIS